MTRVIIYGSGQLGLMAAYILRQQGDVKLLGFIDDNPGQAGKTLDGVPVLGGAPLLPELLEHGLGGAIVAIGDNHRRGEIAKRLSEMGLALVQAVDPSANISATARLGMGALIGPGAIIAFNTMIGDNPYVGPGAVISHDVLVGDNVLLSVGCVVAARVDIADFAFIGAGARVVPARLGQEARLRVGRNAIVGAGAVVLKDVPDNSVVAGVPARVLRGREASQREV